MMNTTASRQLPRPAGRIVWRKDRTSGGTEPGGSRSPIPASAVTSTSRNPRT
jgi:hypothetical protein